MSLRLLSPGMGDDEVYAKRLGFWLRMARERSGKSQAGAAKYLGLSEKSKSTVSDWENGRVPALAYLRRLARWYGVPLEVFTHPELTPDERLDEIARFASDEERQGWESAQEPTRAGEDARDGAPRTRTA